MNQNKVCICSMCGNTLKTVYDFGNVRTTVYNKDSWCDKCDREIVPLATPQIEVNLYVEA